MKSKLNELKAKIKTNSKDAHFADTLIAELLSVKGQIDVEPTLAYVPISDIVDKLEGDTFTMAVLKNGDAVYHLKGGYTIVADGARMYGLAQTIKNHIEDSKTYDTLSDEQREMYDIDSSATTYILNCPTFAFSDQTMKYDIATTIIKRLNAMYETALNADLQAEDKVADAAFENAAIALENIKSELNEKDKE